MRGRFAKIRMIILGISVICVIGIMLIISVRGGDGRVEAGINAYQNHEYNKAMVLFYEAMDMKLKAYSQEELLTWIAIVHGELGSYDQQLDYLHMAIKMNSEYREAWKILGKYYIDHANYEDALNSYSEVIRIDSNDANALARMGECYSYLLKPNEAIEYYLESIRVDDKQAYVYALCALSYGQLNNFEKADEYLELALYHEYEYYEDFREKIESFK